MGNASDPKIGVALGGGAAKGLTHIPFIEAMDELGVKPSIIAGTSIGALLGAGWAAGLEGRQIRELAYDYLGSLRSILTRIWTNRFSNFEDVIRKGLSMQLHAEEVIEGFVPDDLPRQFDLLNVPFKTVSTDLNTWHQVTLHAGPLIPGIASSIAIPSVFRPVEIEGRVLIDGSVVNPLPVDLAAKDSDILIAVDVSGEPQDYENAKALSNFEIGWRSAQIMMHSLGANAMSIHPPDVYARPHVKAFGPLEFWRVREIIEAGETDKERFKRDIGRAIERHLSAAD